ncbi:uncharacterized protein LOC118478945 [Aplysia californica]|uniref:Uncharacterized protein LOC118478945 n=1 Tax=Aplysia californica TaxID=6500 RepID=A0ABM1W3X7_APLCA|nr:uncharacterized protein LOC118478945 [Aplysia californica]
MVYVSDSVSGFFLSYDTMIDLGIIDKHFPTIGGCDSDSATDFRDSPISSGQHQCSNKVNHARSLNAGCTDQQVTEGSLSCSCPQRSSVPDRPPSLPFAPTADNNEKMRAWLLKMYTNSTFNTCPHRPLPCMTGPPIEIHIDDSATPRTCNTAAPVQCTGKGVCMRTSYVMRPWTSLRGSPMVNQ